MRIKILIFATLLATCAAAGSSSLSEFKSMLKTSDPNTLPYYVSISDECPVSKKEVVDMVEGVIVRSRIKPNVNAFYDPEKQFDHLTRVFLSVSLACLGSSTGHYTGAFTVYFGRAVKNEEGTLFPFVFDTYFPNATNGTKEQLFIHLQQAVETRITDYLKANFDQ